jgi:hypothetical protein
MNYNELKAWLSDRLQMLGTAASDINIRRDEAPYEKPVELWKSGSVQFRNDFQRAVLDLVSEACSQPWEPNNLNEMCLLLQAAKIREAAGLLEAVTSSQRLLRQMHGEQLHMLLLRTLLALGWIGSPEFWLTQKKLVGANWPGIVFRGLVRQDVELGFQQLPDLASSRESMLQILNLFPILMRDLNVSISDLRKYSSIALKKLNPNAAEALREYFRLQNYTLDMPDRRVSSGLRIALISVLADGSEPRFLSPMLCGVSDGRCVAA